MMKILVNPDSPPEDLLVFEWLSDSMNSPGKWVVNQKGKMRPYTLTLDGHSTVLVYSLVNGKGLWRSLKEIGTYVLVPEELGEGAVFLPHEYEMIVHVSFEDYDASFKVVCDAEELEAITLELKGQNPDTILEALESTLESMFIKTMELHYESLDLEKKTEMKIPKKVMEQLNYSFGILGLKPRKVVVLSVNEKMPIPKVEIENKDVSRAEESDMKEEYGEVFSPDELEKMPVPPVPRNMEKEGGITAKDEVNEMPSIPTPPGQVSGSPPPPPTQIPVANSYVPKPVAQEEPLEVPGPKVASMPEPLDTKAKRARGKKEEQNKPPKEEGIANLFSSVLWYDRMLLQRSYPLSITISNASIADKETVSSVISGERRTETKVEFQAKAGQDLVIRPEFPGCLVTPFQRVINVEKQEQDVVFWVTPLAKGDLKAKIVFEQENKIIKEVKLEGKIITHRAARIFGWLGLLASAIPPAFAFLFNETPTEFYQTRLSTFAPPLKDQGVALNAGLAILLFAFSGGFYALDRQRQQKMSFYID